MAISEIIRKMKKSSGNSWRPENPEDYIAGEAVTGLRTVDTKFGKRTVIDIRSEADGQIYTVWCTTVIENELRRQGAGLGDQVGFKFLGEKKNYKDFVVHVEKKMREPLGDSPRDGKENRDPGFERKDNLGEKC
ncbi:MAG: hypothetical protein V3T60_13385 [Candidatus Binatia bacterium]